MTEKRLVPKRRFEGFTGEWKKKQYNDLLDKSEGIRRGPFGSALKKEFFVSNSNYVVYEQQNAIHDRYKTRYNITKQKYNELYRFSIKENDFIMSGAGTIGRISRVPRGIKPGVINQALIRIRVNKQLVDLEYFLQWMRSEKMQDKLTQANPASAMVNLVPMSEVKEWEVSIPTLEEQQKIGDFFKRLDEMIALEQRKINKTKALKNAYLTEMFPAEGERVPRRRFEGFTDEWIPFKLKDLIVSEEKGNARADMLGHNSLYLDANFLNGGAPVYINSLTNVKEDDVLILWDGSHAGKVYHGFKGALGSTLKALKPLESGGFIYYFLYFNQKKIFEQYRTPNIPHVINTFTDEFMICKPSLEEQLKISGFFKKIDYIIETHKQKLEKLKAIKQAYLHEMFV